MEKAAIMEKEVLMADTSVSFKCPNCSAPLAYAPGADHVTCEYCGKHFFTSKISLFGDYLVCLCPRCGGRHAITINMVGSYRRIKLLTVAALITVLISPLICRLIFVLYYMWIGQ